MSRIGKKPISLPAGVEVKVDGNIVTIQGPKGSLAQTLPEGISVIQEDNQALVERANDNKQQRSFHGLSRALIANMVEGVTNGFEKNWN